MADDFSRGDVSTDNRSDDEENNLEKPMPKQLTTIVGNIIVKGANKAAGAMEAGVSYVTPNVWPDVDNVDNLVNVLTISGYAVTAFSIVGATYFVAKTIREVFQWRSWIRYRRSIRTTRQRMSGNIDGRKAEK